MAAVNRFAEVGAKRSAPTPTPGSDREPVSKYTVRMPLSQADQFDQDMLDIKRELGRRIEKNTVFGVLVDLFHGDPAVRRAVLDRLG